MKAHELEGERVMKRGGDEVWFILEGRRRKISSPQVFDALFDGVERILTSADIDAIESGSDLDVGTCLIRGNSSPAIFLLAACAEGDTLYEIMNHETFVDCGFDESKVWLVPSVLVRHLPLGPALCSPSSRPQDETRSHA